MESSISEYRNMNFVYFNWVFLLLLNIGFVCGIHYGNKAYPNFLQATIVFPHTFLWLLVVGQVMVFLLALLFKYNQKRQQIGWVFALIIGILGIVYFYLWGYNPWFYSSFVFSELLIIILGPYLHFI